ncbi:hypothetical protein Q2B95_08105 [Stenotrophomonas maltophilia]|uniref:hypothetical protein n=1 Tax=Stenotrophomonas maltophilia TaxID=40324 RepID=UPI0030A655B6
MSAPSKIAVSGSHAPDEKQFAEQEREEHSDCCTYEAERWECRPAIGGQLARKGRQ